VLSDLLGYDADRVAALETSGAIAAGPVAARPAAPVP
jgi:hypothetical protein